MSIPINRNVQFSADSIRSDSRYKREKRKNVGFARRVVKGSTDPRAYARKITRGVLHDACNPFSLETRKTLERGVVVDTSEKDEKGDKKERERQREAEYT